MKELKYFNQLTDYTANKDDFEYPTVSYVEENTNVYYMEKPEEKRILTYTTTGASQQISLVYKQEYLDYCKIVETGEKLTVSGTGVLYYTFDNPGEHQVELKFKDDATTLEYAFYGCTELTSIPANLFSNNTAVTTFLGTFYYCSELTGIPENLFSNNTTVTSFKDTFNGCNGLTSIPENLFQYNTAVTSFRGTFLNCSGLTSIPENLFKYNTAVTTFESTFYQCYGLTSIPANLFSNNTAVTTFSGTFYWCSGITGSIPENLFSNNTAVTNFTGTFRYCSGLTGTVPTDTDGTPIYKRSGEGKSGYAIVTSNYGCFQDCTGLTDYSSIPSSWN